MSGNQNDMHEAFALTFALIALIIGIQWFYSYNKEFCNQVVMTLNWLLLYPFAFFSNSEAHQLFQQFAWHQPMLYDWDNMLALTAVTGSYYRWLFTPILLYMAWIAFTSLDIKSMYERFFSMRTLLQNNIQAFPCIAPVARRDILSLPLNSGYWAAARSPLQYATDHQLIIDQAGNIIPKKWLLEAVTDMANDKSPLLQKGGNKGIVLNKTKTIELFVKQLGPQFVSVNDLPPHLMGLAAAFMEFGCGDKKEGQKMLDNMSLSYLDDAMGKPIHLSIGNAKKIIKKYENDPRVIMATRYHNAYISTWMISLLIFARSKGVLANSQFIWLRPVDRTMFYTLNQVGGRRPWAESIGPWNHFIYEEGAKQPIIQPNMTSAVDDYAREIAALGFLDEAFIPKSRH